jgi:hypothetical protein
MRRILIVALALPMAAGCRSAEVDPAETMPAPVIIGQPAPLLTTASALPIGTTMEVTLNQAINTKSNKVGDRFTATVARPLVTAAGMVAVPQGAIVSGTITALDDSERLIRLSFDRLSWGGRPHALRTDIIGPAVAASFPAGSRLTLRTTEAVILQ